MQARRWCFTSFETDKELQFNNSVKYAVFQVEQAPDTGREHYQGYVEFTSPWRLARVKKLLGSGVHCEVARGNRNQCRDYCMKTETRVSGPFEFGEWVESKQGERTDLAAVYDAIKEGKDESEVLDLYPKEYIKFCRGIREATFVLNKKNAKDVRRTSMECTVYWGASGSGKTRRVHDRCKPNELYSITRDGGSQIWWDGYEGESTLLLDDFYGWISWGFMLRLLDIYPLRLPIKGGHTWARWTRIYITSNLPWHDWYTDTERKDAKALERRITRIYQFGEDGEIYLQKGTEEETDQQSDESDKSQVEEAESEDLTEL